MKRRALSTGIGIALGTALSRATGYLRILALAYLMQTRGVADGATALSDSYVLANTLPNIVYDLLLGGILSATLVPLFTRYFEARDDQAISALVTTATVALGAVTLVATLAAPLVVRLYTLVSLDAAVDADRYRSVATTFAYFFLPQIFFYGITAIATALLNARRRFFAAAWAPLLNNVVVIGILFIARHVIDERPSLELVQESRTLRWLLGFGTTAGVAAMALVLLPSICAAGIRLRFRFDFRHPAVQRLVQLSGWTAAYVVSNQIAFTVITLLAQRESGGLVAYTTMYLIFQLPFGLLAVTMMTQISPELAADHVRKDYSSFRRRVGEGIWAIVLAMAPAAVIFGFLARPITRLVGSFANIPFASDVLSGFAAGLVAFSIYMFVMRAFYAMDNTKTPFAINFIENIFNIVLAVALVGRFGVAGLAWAFSLAYLLAAVFAMRVLALFTRGINARELGAPFVRLLGAVAVTAIAAWFARDNVPRHGLGELAGIAVSSIGVLAIYGLLLVGLGVVDRATVRNLNPKRFR